MDIRSLVMGLVFVLMWSSAFTSARIIVADAPPLGSLALRFLLSGLIGIIIARALGQTWHLTRAQWRGTFVFGINQNVLYLGLNFVAMRTIEASLAAIIASTMPLLVALAGWLVFKERLTAWAYGGLMAGTVGVVIIMGARITQGVDIFGLLLAGIGAVALAVATLTVRSATSGGNLLMIVALQMLIVAVILAGASLALETYVVVWSWKLIAAFAYTTIVPGLLATLIWFQLVNRIGSVRAATFHFLNPFFGVAVAAVLLGETIGVADYLGVAIIMAGILAVQLSKSPPN
jgi:drug/metabolite transporter (DMT)-like permease